MEYAQKENTFTFTTNSLVQNVCTVYTQKLMSFLSLSTPFYIQQSKSFQLLHSHLSLSFGFSLRSSFPLSVYNVYMHTEYRGAKVCMYEWRG